MFVRGGREDVSIIIPILVFSKNETNKRRERERPPTQSWGASSSLEYLPAMPPTDTVNSSGPGSI